MTPFTILRWEEVAHYGEVPPTEVVDVQPLRLGHAVYTDDPDTEEILRWVAWDLGFGPMPEVPSHLLAHGGRPAVELVSEGINAEVISTEFLLGWGRLHERWGWYSATQFEQQGAQASLFRVLAAKRGQSTRSQEQWYARWIQAHARTLLPRDRHGAEDQLVEVCFGIAQGRIEPVVHPKEWFSRMLKGKAPRIVTELKSTYRELSAPELQKLLDDPKARTYELPPTDPAEFRKKIDRRP